MSGPVVEQVPVYNLLKPLEHIKFAVLFMVESRFRLSGRTINQDQSREHEQQERNEAMLSGECFRIHVPCCLSCVWVRLSLVLVGLKDQKWTAPVTEASHIRAITPIFSSL